MTRPVHMAKQKRPSKLEQDVTRIALQILELQRQVIELRFKTCGEGPEAAIGRASYHLVLARDELCAAIDLFSRLRAGE